MKKQKAFKHMGSNDREPRFESRENAWRGLLGTLALVMAVLLATLAPSQGVKAQSSSALSPKLITPVSRGSQLLWML